MKFFEAVENYWEKGRFHIEFILREDERDAAKKAFLIKYGTIYRLANNDKDSLTREDAEILAMAYEFLWHDIAIKCRELNDWSEMLFLNNWESTNIIA